MQRLGLFTPLNENTETFLIRMSYVHKMNVKHRQKQKKVKKFFLPKPSFAAFRPF